MEQIVTITSQGQLTIPKVIKDLFGIKGSVKATIQKRDNAIVVKPKVNFWQLAGSLKSKKVLNDKELKDAREQFAKKWAEKI